MPETSTAEKKSNRSLETFLWGDPKVKSIENRIFNAVMFLAFMNGVLVTFMSLSLGLPTIRLVFGLLTVIAGSIGYYISKNAKNFQRIVVPISYTYLALLTGSWISNYGLHGSSPYYFFVLIVATSISIKGIARRVFIATTGIVVVLLIILEIFYPHIFFAFEISRVESIIDTSSKLMLCLAIIWSMVQIVLTQQKRDRDNLKKALDEVKTLKGYIPICASCKKIRDDKGYWNMVEEYVRDRSEVEFTHSICPDCVKALYGQYADIILKRKQENSK